MVIIIEMILIKIFSWEFLISCGLVSLWKFCSKMKIVELLINVFWVIVVSDFVLLCLKVWFLLVGCKVNFNMNIFISEVNKFNIELVIVVNIVIEFVFY